MPNSLTWNSIDLGDGDNGKYGLVVERFSLPRMSEVSLDVRRPAQGEPIRQGIQKGANLFEIACRVKGTSKDDLTRKMDEILLVLDSDVDRKLQLDQIADRFWNGRVLGEIKPPVSGVRVHHFILPVNASQAFSNSEEDITESVVASPHNFTVPKATGVITAATNATPIVISDAAHGLSDFDRLTVVDVVGNTNANATWLIDELSSSTFALHGSTGNASYISGGTWTKLVGGNEFATPIYYIQNQTGASVNSVVFVNNTTSESLTWTGTLEDDRWLKIDAFNSQISKSTATGADPTVLTFLGETGFAQGSLFQRLKPNVQNSFTITGIATGRVRTIFRYRYL